MTIKLIRMKRIICCFILFYSFTSVVKAQTALDYMKEMGVEYKKIQDDTWGYVKATAHSKSANKIEKSRADLINTVRESIKNIKKLGAFESDKSLLDAAVNYLTLNEIILNEDYAKIVDLEVVADKSFHNMEAYLEAKKQARVKLSNARDQLSIAEREFARKHNINLIQESDEQSEKLIKASEAMDYYNKMYLIFFKSYKQEYNAYNDLTLKDVNAFEESRKKLNEYSVEGSSNADQVGNFKNDPMMKNATKKMMDFFKFESSNVFLKYTDYFQKEAKMNEMSKKWEAIAPENRTNDDVDKYNSVYDEYKQAYDIYVKNYEEITSKRTTLIEEWNNTSSDFLSKYVPK